MEWIGFAAAVIGTVVGLFFRKRAKMARDVAETLVTGIEQGQNTGDHLTPDSVKNTVSVLMENLPGSARDYLDGVIKKVIGG